MQNFKVDPIALKEAKKLRAEVEQARKRALEKKNNKHANLKPAVQTILISPIDDEYLSRYGPGNEWTKYGCK